MINKAFDIPETEEIFEFTDVTTGHLFFEDIQKGKAFGYIVSVMLDVYKYNTHYIPEIKDYDTIGDLTAM